ncbi:zinc-binding dehydrogenase [Aeromicrobium fastidiosum]|uniref:Alcohol dehydrogenase catalytic domain-containing protein n=1 Tax=Aeromicrobium fastidiosum TaxID=52699 RepID=A0A641ANY8_9ACTN|nr:zinc-binding dehydrogenase [Aeromicrobium fastidiosum]KAA1379796.1 alcohol dehydrogenase catalytic domain-containing protein [Aeromicrobium fastidiosum]MBP2389288.1 alcohol dehydrogenase [Aeromicrobium fastidiosum]
MRAVVVPSIAAEPEVREVDAPVAPDGGVVVEVRATGMCRSDWHGWAGHDDIAFPHVPGHELAGVVVEVGAGVTLWGVGDRVTVPFVCGCGTCEWCLAGDAQVCRHQRQPGFTDWGSFAERVALFEADVNLVAIPDAVDFATAASLGCRFATAYRALTSRAHVADGEWVTIVGAGGVGLSTVMIAQALGAHVVVVDRNPEALAAASALGADHALLADDADLATAIHELTDGGSHVSVDAVGSEQTCSVAVHSLRRRGRHVQIGLLQPIDGHPRVPMDRVIGWELDLLGSHGMAAVDYPGMLDLIVRGTLRPQDLIERTIGLEEAADLLPRFDRATVAGMTMIDPSR